MSFKLRRWVCLSFFAITFGVGAGCGLKLNEPPAKKENFNVTYKNSGCWKGMGGRFSSFFEGKSAAKDIPGFFSCTVDIIHNFTQHVKGQKNSQYTPQEIRTFLEKYIVKENKISDELMFQIMDLKQALIGGSDSLITHPEMEKIVELMGVLEVESARIHPYLPLTPEHFESSDLQRVLDVATQIEESTARIAEVLPSVPYASRISNIQDLVEGAERTFRADGKISDFFRKYGDFVQAVKAIIVTPPAEALFQGEWALLLSSGGKAFSLYLLQSYFHKKYENSWQFGDGLVLAEVMANRLKTLLIQSIRQHPDHVIRFFELERLIETVGDLGRLPYGVKVDGYKSVLHPVIQKFMAGQVEDETGKKAQGLTEPAVERLWVHWDRWLEGQKLIERAFQELENHSLDYATAGYLPELVIEKLKSISPQEFEHADLAELAKDDLLHVLKVQRPLLLDSTRRVKFLLNLPKGTYRENRISYHFISSMHWLRALVRIYMDGYIQDPERLASGQGVTREEYQKVYIDFHKFGSQIGFLDPRFDPEKARVFKDTASYRFLETDLFMSTADGNGFLNIDEISEFLQYLRSAKEVADPLHERIAKECGMKEDAEKDRFGGTYIDARCYREKFYDRLLNPQNEPFVFGFYMPSLVKYYQGLHSSSDEIIYRSVEDERTPFQRSLENSVRDNGYSNDQITLGESEGFFMILQYIETAFILHDNNRDGYLDYEEGMQAFPVFKKSLGDIAAAQGVPTDEAFLENLFVFMMKNGTAPTTWWQKLKFGVWKYNPLASNNFKADRQSILGIMESLGKLKKSN